MPGSTDISASWSAAHAKLHVLLRQQTLLPRGSRILVAVSGGQDSLCLARLLTDLGAKWGWALGWVHCDHGWRADSAKNAAHVVELAKTWQVPIWVELANSLTKSEAAARQWRYEVFARIAKEQGYSYVVTGHTKSDRAETVLYNLLRGTGTDGLGTLRWTRPLSQASPLDLPSNLSANQYAKQSQSTTLVRPLLDFTRAETARFCQDQQISVWEDSSNQDLNFRRNRIRLELMPYLRSHFNPQIEQAVAQLAEITAADIDYLNAQTERIYRRTVHGSAGDQAWSIRREALIAEPRSLQRRVIKQLLHNVLPSPPSFAQVEKLLALLSAANGSQTDPYPGGWIAIVKKPIISLELLGLLKE
ncbi:tRNA lysidine(34) synthetase TilS [cf. Phormidesmis sp. LEGE 11477]|uniref:tRNA lysidine(34) synthetase TilS n=1 Tax=cf. Phormidesmis sp. LEGE 11477 TaxID=1828680 RepID=UPI001880C242|nr:tRNA lysidine(34) synthetase TilS [cf. Phormidesmis sp. LEGE 11477]MBE9060128.1 tRNA lysidine(34) synthetase TilS [cf. Phormidesmis sp. LEGE 11477]